VKATFAVIALIKPFQLKESSVNDAIETPRTIGAKVNQRVTGICWPRMNCEAAALKKGSSAVKFKQSRSYPWVRLEVTVVFNSFSEQSLLWNSAPKIFFLC
jgi:hypothetical protein